MKPKSLEKSKVRSKYIILPTLKIFEFWILLKVKVFVLIIEAFSL